MEIDSKGQEFALRGEFFSLYSIPLDRVVFMYREVHRKSGKFFPSVKMVKIHDAHPYTLTLLH